jgi:hypothetical protein
LPDFNKESHGNQEPRAFDHSTAGFNWPGDEPEDFPKIIKRFNVIACIVILVICGILSISGYTVIQVHFERIRYEKEMRIKNAEIDRRIAALEIKVNALIKIDDAIKVEKLFGFNPTIKVDTKTMALNLIRAKKITGLDCRAAHTDQDQKELCDLETILLKRIQDFY